jgi:transcriptional regulator
MMIGNHVTGAAVGRDSLDLVQGTVDVLILRTLAWGPKHGYGIKGHVRDQTGGTITIESAALYQALHRLEKKKLVRAWWGLSETNRRARYYDLTAAGKKHLQARSESMREYVGALMRVLDPS